MSEQILIKKKKRLVTDFNSLTPEELIKSGKELREKLKKVFSKHIGKENALSPWEIFEQVLEVNPEQLDIFQRMYWWGIIKSILKQMRHSEELFTIVTTSRVFVLQTREEADRYKGGLDRHITALDNLKIKADKWVRNKLWEKL
jgi:hypothetical protein